MITQYILPQYFILFLAGIIAVASQPVDPDPSTVNKTSCSSIPFDVLRKVDGDNNVTVYQLPFIEECLASVQVDKENMLQHIRDLNKILAQAYVFYNFARNPAASVPKDHQAELGYTIFDGPLEGMVDIDVEMKNIVQKVEGEGASWATFWDIQSVANRLRDGHVAMPQTNADLGDGHLFFIPERCADGKIKGRHSFSNDPMTGELELKIHWKDIDGAESESVVESMNGGSPYDFFLNVSNSPSIFGIDYQSRGARFNALLMQLTKQSRALAEEFGDNSKAILPVLVNARPSDAYPTEVRVKYASGDEEIYRTFLFPRRLNVRGTGPTVRLNDTALQEYINLPGNVYVRAEQVVRDKLTVNNRADISDTPWVIEVPRNNRAAPQTRNSEDDDVMTDAENETFWNFEVPEDDPYVAVKLTYEYAVFKVESFEDLEPEQLMLAWQLLTKMCKNLGIKKLIVDVSNNGGGLGVSSATLATLMYPSVKQDFVQSIHEAVINNPMQIFRDEVIPLFDTLNEEFNSDDNTTEAPLRYTVDRFTDDHIEKVSETIGILQTFGGLQTSEGGKETAAALIDDLQKQWTAFETNRTVHQLQAVVKDMVLIMKSCDRLHGIAWQQAYNEEKAVNSSHYLGLPEMEVTKHLHDLAQVTGFLTSFRSVDQGGVLTNVTDRFYDYEFTTDLFDEVVQAASQNGAEFEEYIVLSNGVAASASSFFSSKVEQIWKNKDRTFVETKLTTVSYGGLKEGNGDVTMAGVPAPVEEINIERWSIQLLIVGLFNDYFLDSLSEIDPAYLESIPAPPYFSHTKPSFPVSAIYDNFMGPGALPLQCIKMPADKHIPFYYLGTTFQDDSDLEVLYGKTAEFFSTAEDGEVESGGITADDVGETAESESFTSATDLTTSIAALIGLSGIVRVAAISTALAFFAVV